MNKPVIMLGAGGHARVLLTMLDQLRVPVSAVSSPEQPKAADFPPNVIRLAEDDGVFQFNAADYDLVNGLGSLPGRDNQRQRLHQLFSSAGYTFSRVISPTAHVAGDCYLAEGVQIMPGAILNSCRVSRFTLINSGAIVEHDVAIGEHCHIAPGAVICGDVTLGEQVHVGAGATVIQGITIGANTVIGAGATITQDIPANAIVYPAKPFITERT